MLPLSYFREDAFVRPASAAPSFHVGVTATVSEGSSLRPVGDITLVPQYVPETGGAPYDVDNTVRVLGGGAPVATPRANLSPITEGVSHVAISTGAQPAIPVLSRSFYGELV